MYQNTQARVITHDGNTKLIKILPGMLLGNILAPYLFTIAFDYATWQAHNEKEEEKGIHFIMRSIRHDHPIIITGTDFFDDRALISDQISKVQETLTRV